MSVKDIEASFGARLAQFSELEARVKFDFGDDVLFIDGTKNPAVMTHADEDADCTLSLSADDLTKILDGQLDPTMAFMTGKVKVKGATAVAMKLGAVLK